MMSIATAILSGTAIAVLAIWVVSYPALVRHLQSLLARRTEEPNAPAPWRGRTVLLVVIAWLAVSLIIPGSYVFLKDRLRGRADGPAGRFPSDSKTIRTAVRAQEVVQADTAPSGSQKGRGAASEPDESFLSFNERIILISVMNGLLLIVIPFILRLDSDSVMKELGLDAISLRRDFQIGAVAFLVITPVVLGINLIAIQVWIQHKHPLELMLRKGLGPATVVLAYLSATILAPVAEEILFRGVIQGWLRRVWNRDRAAYPSADLFPEGGAIVATALGDPVLRWIPRPLSILALRVPSTITRRWTPIVLTSALFAMLHFEQMPAPFAIFALSLMLGRLYDSARGLLPAIVLHSLFNGFNTTLMLLALRFPPSPPPPKPVPESKIHTLAKPIEEHSFSLPRVSCSDRLC